MSSKILVDNTPTGVRITQAGRWLLATSPCHDHTLFDLMISDLQCWRCSAPGCTWTILLSHDLTERFHLIGEDGASSSVEDWVARWTGFEMGELAAVVSWS